MGWIAGTSSKPTMNGTTHTRIKIWQQNTRRSLDAQLALLNSLENNFDIVCIQEPHFDYLNISRATRVWHSVYSSTLTNSEDRPHALTLIHKRLSTNSWSQIHVDSHDVVAVNITDGTRSLAIYNMYNDCEH